MTELSCVPQLSFEEAWSSALLGYPVLNAGKGCIRRASGISDERCGLISPKSVRYAHRSARQFIAMARPQEFDTQEVLRKAMTVFWEKGFEATSIADLMAATALSKSSLYGSFGDKRELFLAAFDAYRNDRKRDMIHLLSAEPSRRGIVSFFESLFANLDSNAHKGCMSVNQAVEMAPRDLVVRAMVAEDFHTIQEALKDSIQRGQADGSVTNSADAEDIASILVLAFPGLQLMARIGVGSAAMSKTLALLMKQLD